MKKAIKAMNDRIVPGEELAGKVMEAVSAPKTVRARRPLMAVATVLAVILLVTPVMAGNAQSIAELMYYVSPEMAARFTPVGKSVEKHGIRMEVVAASFHGPTVELCVSFEDLEGERVTEVFSTVSNRGSRYLGMDPFVGYGSRSDMIDEQYFDPETGKYYMIFRGDYAIYSEFLGRNLTIGELFHGKLTFCIDELQWKNDDGTVGILQGPWMIGLDIEECDYVGVTIPNATTPPQ